MDSDTMSHLLKLDKRKQSRFLHRFLESLPSSTVSLDTSRVTIVFFVISGLSLLKSLDINESTRNRIIEWIYRQQLDKNGEDMRGNFGFRGSPSNGIYHSYDLGHLAMTYSALVTLIVLNDDLSRVNRKLIKNGLREFQLDTGCAVYGGESDMRFVYCAACICHLLDDWSLFDVDKSVEFISRSLSYEGAFGLGPGHEAHGGSTYCAVASLILMKRLNQVLNERQIQKLVRWCLFKQYSGFSGRPNKDPDTCYSFWMGATLKLLNAYSFVHQEENIQFVLSTVDEVKGGLAKFPDSFPDVLHTFLGISGLSLMDDDNTFLQTVDASLNIPKKILIQFLEEQKQQNGL